MTGKKKKSSLNTTSLGMGQTVHVQRSGEAASQMIQAYKGKLYDSAGTEIINKKRSLERISEYKINPDQAEKNYKQQAGFAAEQIEEARSNKEAILNGEKNRTRTSDDVGTVNDRVNDLVLVDKNGNIIEGSGTQVKFYGVGKKGNYTVVDKLAKNSDWDRYDSVLIPEDQYEGALKYADEMAEKCRKNAAVLRQRGNTEEAKKQERLAERYETAKSRLRKSKATLDEALEARKDPEKFVAKEVAGDCINAGLQSMKYSALIGGAVAVAQNTAAVFCGDKDMGEAVADVIDVTADSAFTGFVVGTSGTALKSLMHVSKSELVRRLGTTNAPTAIVTGIMDISKSLTSFARGEIDSLQLFEQLGEKGVCSVASGIGAGIGGNLGALVSPAGAIVGGIAGGMASYAVCSAIYNSAAAIINDARYARERRTEIELIRDQAVRNMRIYQAALEDYSRRQTRDMQLYFNTFFDNVDKCAKARDIDGVFNSFNSLDEAFGFLTKFGTYEEFEGFMEEQGTVLTL